MYDRVTFFVGRSSRTNQIEYVILIDNHFAYRMSKNPYEDNGYCYLYGEIDGHTYDLKKFGRIQKVRDVPGEVKKKALEKLESLPNHRGYKKR